jgi:aryl-alcohol dehydrogenase-like predicted oxidoreductase
LNIRRAVDGSLKRLQTDHIDLYQMHHIDRNTPWEEIWQAMEVLVQQGKILYVGSSNFAGWHIAQANEIARSRHFLGLVSEQCLYNLKVRAAEMDVIPACREYGLGVIPWSPLASGLLAGSRGKEQAGRRGEEGVSKEMEKYAVQISQYEEFCKEMGEIPANVALAWLLANPVVTAPIVGPRKMEQLTESLRAAEIKFSPEQMQKLDEIWPGPGGESPEAFAW